MMQTEPDELTEHNELILSISIERIVIGRNSALKQIEQLIQQLDAISHLVSEIGGGYIARLSNEIRSPLR